MWSFLTVPSVVLFLLGLWLRLAGGLGTMEWNNSSEQDMDSLYGTIQQYGLALGTQGLQPANRHTVCLRKFLNPWWKFQLFEFERNEVPEGTMHASVEALFAFYVPF